MTICGIFFKNSMTRRAGSDSDQDQISVLPGMLYICRQRWKDEYVHQITPHGSRATAGDSRRYAMKTETIEALRAPARRLGPTGYSKLRKHELLKLIAGQQRK